MSHAFALLLAVAGAALLERAAARGGALRPLAAGLCFGLLVAVRPLDGVVAGTLAGAAALVARVPLPRLVAYAAGCALGAAVLLAYDARVTGDPFSVPFNWYTDRLWHPGANRMGFGPEVGPPPDALWGNLDPLPGHGLRDVLLNLNQNLVNVNVELFGWGVGSLALVILHAACGRPSRLDRALGLAALVLVAAHAPYWFAGGPDFGARYWFLASVPLVWLSLRGAETLAGRLAALPGAAPAGPRVAAAVVALCAVGLAVFGSWRAVARYPDYRGFHADAARIARSHDLAGSLVFVRAPAEADWASWLAASDPLLREAAPVFARDLGTDANARVARAFPARRVFFVLGRSAAGDGAARLVAGPLPPGAAPPERDL
jgi:hypothetical protein